MLDPGINVLRHREESRVDSAGKPFALIVVTFTVKEDGPFTESFQKVDYSAEARDYRLNAFARELRTT